MKKFTRPWHMALTFLLMSALTGPGLALAAPQRNTKLALTLQINPTSVNEGGTATGTVSHNGSTTSALTVTLQSSNSNEVTVPATMTIPTGSQSLQFDINALSDANTEGNQTYTITASATNYRSSSASLTVVDVSTTTPPDSQLPPVRYDFHWIGTFGGVQNWARDMNQHGDIVGRAQVSGTTSRGEPFPDTVDEFRGFLSTVVGGERVLIDLYELLSEEDQESWIILSECYAINDAGVIVGNGLRWVDKNNHEQGWKQLSFIFIPGYTDDSNVAVPPVIRDFLFNAAAINLAGFITGEFTDGDGENHACLVEVDLATGQTIPGTFTDLGVLYAQDNFSRATSLNSFADVAGFSASSAGNMEAFRYDHEQKTMVGLGIIKKNRGGYWASSAYGINDLGEIVGQSSAGAGNYHACRWSASTLTDLGTLGGAYSTAYSINNFAEIVGHSHDRGGKQHAFLYIDGYGMNKIADVLRDTSDKDTFNLLVPDRDIAINDASQIMGNSGGGAYLLTPVPVTP